jgi:hypothetical protein
MTENWLAKKGITTEPVSNHHEWSNRETLTRQCRVTTLSVVLP